MGKDVALGSNLISMHKKCTEQKHVLIIMVFPEMHWKPFHQYICTFFGEKSEFEMLCGTSGT